MHILGRFQGEQTLCPLSTVTASDMFLSVCHKVINSVVVRKSKLKETQYLAQTVRQKEYWST